MIRLLDILRFGSSAHQQPVLEALGFIRRFTGTGNITYYPLGEVVPMHRGLRGDWEDVVHRPDTRGRRRVVRMVCEVATFQALRDALRCKEIWAAGADRWRDPDDDLPADYAARRLEHYRSLRKPIDPSVFVDELREQMDAELGALNDALPKLGWLEIAERRSGAIHGLAAARARGRKGGRRPKLDAEQIALAQQLDDAGERTVQQIADLFNVPRTTVYGHLEQSSKGRRPAGQRAVAGA